MNAYTFPGMVPGAISAPMPGLGHNGGPSLLDSATTAALLGFNDAEQRIWNFFVSQVAKIEEEVFQVQYPDIRYQELIPVDTTGDPWMQSVVYFSSDRIGQAQWFNAGAQDVPLVQLTRNQFATHVQMAAIGYGFNEEELAIATRMGTNLQGDKAAAARRAAEEFTDRVVLFGDATVNFTGMLNSSVVTAGSPPADGTGSATTFASKTPTLILRDFNAALTGIWTGTSGVEMANTVLMPQNVWADLSTRPRADDSDMTVLEYLVRNNSYTAFSGQPLTIRTIWGLNTAGSGATARMVFYRRAPDVLKFHMPMPFQFRPPWRKGPLMFEVPGILRLGGVDIKKPAAIRYLDGV